MTRCLLIPVFLERDNKTEVTFFFFGKKVRGTSKKKLNFGRYARRVSIENKNRGW